MRNRDLEVSWRGGGGGVDNFQCRPINPVILFYLMELQHETSREQLQKQSRPETASDYTVDKTTGVPSSRFEKTQTIYS